MAGRVLRATILVVGAVIVVLYFSTKPEHMPTYQLSNNPTISNQAIATNDNNVGAHLPSVNLADAENQIVETHSLLGAPTIINIWYSTCEPCRRELPVLASSNNQFGERVKFIGINIKDSAPIAIEFAKNYGVDYQILFDRNGEFIAATGIGTLPVTLAVDAQGVIVDQVSGELSAQQLQTIINELLT